MALNKLYSRLVKRKKAPESLLKDSILKASSPFFSASNTLSKANENILRGKILEGLESHQKGFRPIWSNALEVPERHFSTFPNSVVLGSKNVNGSKEYIENDITHNFVHSAEEANLKAIPIWLDSLSESPDNLLHSIDKSLNEIRPKILVFDGNLLPDQQGFDGLELHDLCTRHSIFLVTVIGDSYDARADDALGYWGKFSDLSITFNRGSRWYNGFEEKRKLLGVPFLPFAKSLYPKRKYVRSYDLHYSGSDTRGRRVYMDFAAEMGVNTFARFHNRKKSTTPNLMEFYSELTKSNLAFGNGWLSHTESIITGRVAEAIMAGAVCIYATGSELDNYLIPYAHYIPIQNAHELVIVSQFLMQNEKLRTKIANCAYDFYMQHYSAKKLWNYVLHQYHIARLK